MSSEELVQQNIRLALARDGFDLWRNNVGACQDENGRVIRYGLMNDSKKLNERFKSSDLIGIRPMRITPEWVGHTVGVFVAIECKSDNRAIKINDPHVSAQARFIDLVSRNGGFAGFAQSVTEARRIMRLE
jgi:hypothetical protein